MERPREDTNPTESGEIYSSGFGMSSIGEGDPEKGVLKGHQELGRRSFLGNGPQSLFHFPIPSTHPSLRVHLPCVILAAVTEL